jgi:hypothetical protein
MAVYTNTTQRVLGWNTGSEMYASGESTCAFFRLCLVTTKVVDNQHFEGEQPQNYKFTKVSLSLSVVSVLSAHIFSGSETWSLTLGEENR